jgi:scyllo-inositol 2-dehydrogenase (NADP+)
LLTWYFGRPESVSGTVLGKVFSTETEDEVFTTLKWPSGVSGQLSVSWSDESLRKMTTRISIWGTNGKIFADRQEIQVYLRGGEPDAEGYGQGWTVRYTTELTEEVDFYVRGEEYSSQLDTWLKRIAGHAESGRADFAEASITDEVLYAILNSADGNVQSVGLSDGSDDIQPATPTGFWSWFKKRRASRGTHTGKRG